MLLLPVKALFPFLEFKLCPRSICYSSHKRKFGVPSVCWNSLHCSSWLPVSVSMTVQSGMAHQRPRPFLCCCGARQTWKRSWTKVGSALPLLSKGCFSWMLETLHFPSASSRCSSPSPFYLMPEPHLLSCAINSSLPTLFWILWTLESRLFLSSKAQTLHIRNCFDEFPSFCFFRWIISSSSFSSLIERPENSPNIFLVHCILSSHSHILSGAVPSQETGMRGDLGAGLCALDVWLHEQWRLLGQSIHASSVFHSSIPWCNWLLVTLVTHPSA